MINLFELNLYEGSCSLMWIDYHHNPSNITNFFFLFTVQATKQSILSPLINDNDNLSPLINSSNKTVDHDNDAAQTPLDISCINLNHSYLNSKLKLAFDSCYF